MNPRGVILSREDSEGSPARSRRGSLRFAALSVGMTLALGCAAAAPQNKTAPANEPEIHISQLSKVSEEVRHVTGGLSVQYRVEVTNRANQPITVKRIDVVSIGEGAYALRPTSYPFDVQLKPGEGTALEFWSSVVIDNPTIVGANGPVTVRVSVQYDAPSGRLQSIVMQQIHALPGAD